MSYQIHQTSPDGVSRLTKPDYVSVFRTPSTSIFGVGSSGRESYGPRPRFVGIEDLIEGFLEDEDISHIIILRGSIQRDCYPCRDFFLSRLTLPHFAILWVLDQTIPVTVITKDIRPTRSPYSYPPILQVSVSLHERRVEMVARWHTPESIYQLQWQWSFRNNWPSNKRTTIQS